MNQLWVLILIFHFFLTILGCKSEYEKMADRELRKNVKEDSLFFDYRLGESKDSYHEKSWDLNHNKIVVQGRSYTFMKYVFQDPKAPKKQNDFIMEYTGGFNKERKLNNMKVIFSHVLWVPWNEDYHASQLLPRVLDSIERWYGGNEFVKYEFKNDTIATIYVKVDSDRRFRAYIENTQDIIVKIDDLDESN